MNGIKVNGTWNVIQGKLKQKWARLTGDPVRYFQGRQQELRGRIQQRTSETREAHQRAPKVPYPTSR